MDATKPTLAGRRILLGVTGGIAAYKAAELTRRFKDAGADVQVVMTASATEFIQPLTFSALSGRATRTALFDEQAEAAMSHIELARWADAIVVAPATGNFLARLTQGMADDLLTTLCLATDRPVFVAPAMNRLMWANAATQHNIQTLAQRGVRVLGPGAGFQACGETGEGRMWEATQIRDAVADSLCAGPLKGVSVALTAGPTREPVDPVRVLTNRSSGKMGYALAEALAAMGAQVTLISGPTSLPVPAGVTRVDVETAADMLKASQRAAQDAAIFIGTAAVADYAPADAAEQKIKKNDATLTLALVKTADVLMNVREAHPTLFMVGFAAETEKLEAHARQKLEKKKLQLVCANDVSAGQVFERDENAITAFWANGQKSFERQSKSSLARQLAALIAEHFVAQR